MGDVIEGHASLDYAWINIFPNQNRLVSANAIIIFFDLELSLRLGFQFETVLSIAENSNSFKCPYASMLCYSCYMPTFYVK